MPAIARRVMPWCLLACALLMLSSPAGARVARYVGWNQPALVEDEGPVPRPEVYDQPRWKAGPEHALLKAARAEEKKNNFRRALEQYQAFGKAAPDDYDLCAAWEGQAAARLRLREYDQALAGLQEALKSRPGAWCEARLELALAAAWGGVPAYGYEREGTISYNLENREGQYVYAWQRNHRKAERATERALMILLELAGRPQAQWKAFALRGEDVLQAMAAAAWAWRGRAMGNGTPFDDGCTPTTSVDLLGPEALAGAYDPAWHGRQKALFLTSRVLTLARALSRPALAAEALFQRGLFLRQHPECAPPEWQRQGAERAREQAAADQARGYSVSRGAEPWDAGPELNPFTLVQAALDEHPANPSADVYLGTLGKMWASLGFADRALETYQDWLKRFPKSRYVGEIRNLIAGIKHPSLGLSGQPVFYPGEPIPFQVSVTNTPRVTFEAYRVDLMALVSGSGKLKQPYGQLTDLDSLVGDIEAVRAWLKPANRVASWTWDGHAREAGPFRVSGEVRAPAELDQAGAYLVHARGEGIDAIHVVIRTDLVVLGRVKGAQVLYATLDWKRGAAVAEVEVLVKESWWQSTWLGSDNRVEISRGRSNQQGEFVHPFRVGENRSSNVVQVLARRGQSYAFVGQQYPNTWQPWHEQGGVYKAFTYTDRPVYRPSHQVKWRSIVRVYADGQYRPAAREQVTARILGPKGDQALEEVLTTDEFGVIASHYTLEEGCDLGAWSIQLHRRDGQYVAQNAGMQFRVEEYKKPEFKVEVKPSASLARLGEEVTARVEARYYFGAPVSGANVKYTVYRSGFAHWYWPPSRWDWLYGEG
jgi:tetratricopeptide (TPR) repeat protein